jgi:precorrin-2 dehydrogenase/sirohydrochlorin ferrochelatase
MFPILLDLASVPVAIVGEGEAALRRLRLLETDGAGRITVFSPGPGSALAAAAGARLVARRPSFEDIAAQRILFVAGLAKPEAGRLAAAARGLGVLVNTEDVPALCDFHVPAIIRRGDLTLTVSTAGASPALARLLKQRIESAFDTRWGERLAEAAEWREVWRAQGLAGAKITELTEQRMHERGWI